MARDIRGLGHNYRVVGEGVRIVEHRETYEYALMTAHYDDKGLLELSTITKLWLVTGPKIVVNVLAADQEGAISQASTLLPLYDEFHSDDWSAVEVPLLVRGWSSNLFSGKTEVLA